jgi:hypothetical protein
MVGVARIELAALFGPFLSLARVVRLGAFS